MVRALIALACLVAINCNAQAGQFGSPKFSNTPTVGRPGKYYAKPKLGSFTSHQEAIDPSALHGLIGRLLGNPEPSMHALTPEEVLENVHRSREPRP